MTTLTSFSTTPDKIRNLSIVAHIDHGKSTLSDRILELTGAVSARDMRDQYLDSMDIERERGITIKAQNVRVYWKGYTVHLIDTPGHVDFGYEVSRSLAACEGVVLLVDAAQGIEAQTLAHAYLALEHDLEIVVVLNKIDLPAADPERCAAEIEAVLGHRRHRKPCASRPRRAKGSPNCSTPSAPASLPPRATRRPRCRRSFSTPTTTSTGACQLRPGLQRACSRSGEKLRFMQTGRVHEIEEVGVRLPVPTEVQSLGPGEVGYVIAGIKDVGEARSGETVTEAAHPAEKPLEGYQEPKPMVFCGLYPVEGDEFESLRDALEKLRLSDSSVSYQPETSAALGFGFRCGFLGLLHMDIVRERLETGVQPVARSPPPPASSTWPG